MPLFRGPGASGRTPRLIQFGRRRTPLLACALAACACLAAAPAKPTARKPRPPEQKAWIEAKTLCVFPLAKDGLPHTGGQLADSMLGGWRDIFAFRDPAAVLDLRGGRYPAVDSMFVDLSGAVANPTHQRGHFADYVPVTKSLAVHNFAMVAEPMLSHKAKINLRVTGHDVRFDLQHDKAGQPILMLADAHDGMLHFDVTRADLERLLLASARESGGTRALTVRSVEVDIRNLSPRALTASVHLRTLVGFIPAGMTFTARIDIDDRMYATISGLTCAGDDLLGPLIVGLIRPGLAKYEGKTKPLLCFPSGNVRLRDVQIHGGESIDLTAAFGR